MSTDTEKNELLEDFQKYLQQNSMESFSTKEQPDLNTLLLELSGLKTEVKIESRQFKSTLDSLSSALTTVQDDNKSLSRELTERTQRLQQQQDEVMRTLLLQVVEIYDGLISSLDILQNYQPVNSLFKSSRKKDIHVIDGFKQGQLMTIKRFEQFLQAYQVKLIDCVGLLFDPVTMCVIETANEPEYENGKVLEELRRGFLFQDQVLRLAEVKVNKTI